MRPKPTPKKAKRPDRKKRLDALEAAETRDWVHDKKKREARRK